MAEIHILETPNLGDRSYLVHDGQVAVVIDPQRDIDRVLDLAQSLGVRIAAVAETHLHNDYLTGGLALARQTGADYLVAAADDVAFERTGVTDCQEVQVGTMTLRVLATPGHTPGHVAYTLEVDGELRAVFTGGSLLYGSTGRTDLVSPELTVPLAHAQWASVRRLGAVLPGTTEVFPTHGFGSFCSASPTSGSASTIAEQRVVNPALTRDEEEFVAAMLAGLDDYPAYYAHMGPGNAAGPTAPDLSLPHVADAAELRRRIEAGEWVVDLRSRIAFAAGHVPGTIHLEGTGNVATYLGWLIPWGTPLTLLASTAAEVAAVQRELLRIGIDRLAAMAVGGPTDWAGDTPLHSFRLADFTDLAKFRADGGDAGASVLDVRSRSERESGAIPDTLHIPLHELAGRLEEIPPGAVWVHCAGGFRASIAASLLVRAGREVICIDDDFATAPDKGHPIERVQPAGVGS